MTLFFYILIGIITFIAFLHAYTKKEYDVSRTIVINKSKSEVFAFVRQLKNQKLWMHSFQNQKNIVFKYKGEDGYEGASFYWNGKADIGEGIQKIIKIKEGKVMESRLFFVRPFKITAISYIAVKEIEGEKTKLVWGIKGRHKFPASVCTLFYSTDRMFGNEIVKSLDKLKEVVESR